MCTQSLADEPDWTILCVRVPDYRRPIRRITFMPEISRFYGLVIRMYYDEHPPPHFHVVYRNAEATLRIDTLEVLQGVLPRRALVLVLEWAMAHRDELRQNWERIERGEPMAPIEPLE
jgi:hypothetical protein